MALCLTPPKNMYTGIDTFVFGGVFGVSFAKIIIFFPIVLVLSINFSVHSISGSSQSDRVFIITASTIFL